VPGIVAGTVAPERVIIMGEATVRVDGAGAGRVNPGAGFPTTATLLCFAVSVAGRALTVGVLIAGVESRVTAGFADSPARRELWLTLTTGFETGRISGTPTVVMGDARVPGAEAARGAAVAFVASDADFAVGAAFLAISEPIRDAGTKVFWTSGVNGCS
jgi:hypothetical protein